jgi:hypothetical protein
MFKSLFIEQTLNRKPSPVKKIGAGTSFFDRVRLPKSFGLRRIEMIDAWTQTSDRGTDNEETQTNDLLDKSTSC